MNVKTILGAAAVALISAAPAWAVPVNVNFSFDGGTGTFFGLDNSQHHSVATGAVFNGTLDDYTLDGSLAERNAFHFMNGILEEAHFVFKVATPGNTFANVLLTDFQLHDHGHHGVAMFSTETQGPLTAQFNSLPTLTTVSSVPLPAGGLLLLSGFAGFAALRRRNKPTA